MIQNTKLKETNRQNKSSKTKVKPKQTKVTPKLTAPSFPSASIKDAKIFGSPVHTIIAAAEKKLSILFGTNDELEIIKASENSKTPPATLPQDRRKFLAEPKGWAESILTDSFDDKF